MMEIRIKHLLHSTAFICVLIITIRMTTNVRQDEYDESSYPRLLKWILHILSLTPLLQVPVSLANFLGLLLYDCFPDDVKLNANLSQLPTICFRVVTKGRFPELILKNLAINLKIIKNVKLVKYRYEIVTETPIAGLEKKEGSEVTEIVVPVDYETKKGTLFKARNLQYCLEDGVNSLKDTDWIVNMDEDTILTENAVRGVANFVRKNEHSFGKGVTQLDPTGCDVFSQILDKIPILEFGEMRFHFKFHNSPHFILRTVFLIGRVDSFKRVSFEVEAAPSLVEDVALGLLMRREGFSCGYVEGHVIEQPLATLREFLQCRIRILKGTYYIVTHSTYFSILKCKIFCLYILSRLYLPLFSISILFGFVSPVNVSQPLLFLKGFNLGLAIYTQVFTVLKTRHNSLKEYVGHIILSVLFGLPISIVTYIYIFCITIYTYGDISFYNSKKIH